MSIATAAVPTTNRRTRTARKAKLTLTIDGTDYDVRALIEDGEVAHSLNGPTGPSFRVDTEICHQCGRDLCPHVVALHDVGLF